MRILDQPPVPQAVPGSRFYTALSAACLGIGVGTINFLVDQGALVQLPDPVSGPSQSRVPLLPPIRSRKRHRELPGHRAVVYIYKGMVLQGIQSKKEDCVGVIQALLQYDAVQCSFGHRPRAESGLTSLKLALRRNAPEDIISIFKDGTTAEESALLRMIVHAALYNMWHLLRCKYRVLDPSSFLYYGFPPEVCNFSPNRSLRLESRRGTVSIPPNQWSAKL